MPYSKETKNKKQRPYIKLINQSLVNPITNQAKNWVKDSLIRNWEETLQMKKLLSLNNKVTIEPTAKLLRCIPKWGLKFSYKTSWNQS
jgi:uncharacterized protein HemY